jgi:anti-sigma-K factor RskA
MSVNPCGQGLDAGAYVLGALEPHEHEAFERHLLLCETCREEVTDLRVAAEALPLAPPRLAPAPELKDRIMAVVRGEAELLAATGPQADRPENGRHAREPWWRRRLALRPAVVGGLAAAALAVGAAAGVLAGGDSGDGGAREVVAQVRPAGAAASVLVRDGRATLVVRRMPPPPRGRVYQVWIQRPGAAPAPTDALFSTTKDGRASVAVPGTTNGVARVLVTAEPDGGSPEPTSAPVLVASLT